MSQRRRSSSLLQWLVILGMVAAVGCRPRPSVVMSWGPDWRQVYAIDDGGPKSTAAALRILREYRDAGALGVRMLDVDPDWLKPLYKQTRTKRVVLYGWATIFDPKLFVGQTDEYRYGRWVESARAKIATWDPEILILDQEKGARDHPRMIQDLRAMLALGTPLWVYRGQFYFGYAAGDGPCPMLFDIWKGPRSPLDNLDDLLKDHPVRGGYPWLSVHRDAHKLSLGLIGQDKLGVWIKVCERLEKEGALGFSLYPAPYSSEHGEPLFTRDDLQLLRFMRAGAAVFWGGLEMVPTAPPDYGTINPAEYE